ncbi:hypothetical protein HWQ46_26880 [Shewanella sp. D64]|nr:MULTISPECIES: hypothetical protein [unclassified Shewanella]MEC4729130.1 hypothetical protein [Shewanella sp. D64]MEC4740538.1 hypothetical protein [Shewanella sp. E94]WBJ94796.1 hypothetical protein HWQ47_23580 [Shewanella sp. MTB7]
MLIITSLITVSAAIAYPPLTQPDFWYTGMDIGHVNVDDIVKEYASIQ